MTGRGEDDSRHAPSPGDRGRTYPGPVPDTTPVVVVGSGAAGLAAALAASGAGADVLVVERAHAVGGTTAMSGGVVWMPAHGRNGRSTTLDDSPQEALAYLGAAADGDVDAALMRAFVSDARRVTDEIENRTPIEWEVLEHWPDYRGELPGAKTGGRSLWPRALRLSPEIEARVQAAFDQPSPAAPHPAAPNPAAPNPAQQESATPDPATPDPATPDPATPANDGVVLRGHVRGRALAGGLLSAVVDSGIEVRTGARATRLVVEDGRVTGVIVDGHFEAGRVVLASGGFQHDAGLVGELLGGPPVVAMGPAGCSGDGLRMARDVGAVLGNTSEGWWMPAMSVPGEDVDGVRHYRPLHGERAQPGAIMIDRFGRRFVDEAQSYGEVGRAMRARSVRATRATRPRRAGWCSTPPTAAATRWALSSPPGPTRTGWRAPRASPSWPGSRASRRARWSDR